MLRHAALSVAACLAAAIFSLAGARAEDQTGDSIARHLLGTVPDKMTARACFVRVYDAAHLARHPQQKVTAMMLLISGEIDAEEGAVNYAFSLGVKLRPKAARYTSGGDCGHAKVGDSDGTIALSCGVDCDGGGLSIALAKDDKSTLVSFDEIAISPAGNDDESARTSLEAGADDRSFRLERTRLADCLRLIPDEKQAAAGQRGM